MNGAEGFPNPNNETLQPNTTIEGTPKPVQPFFVIAVNHKSVATETKSVVAHKWAWWLYNPCCLGAPNASEQRTNSAVAHK